MTIPPPGGFPPVLVTRLGVGRFRHMSFLVPRNVSGRHSNADTSFMIQGFPLVSLPNWQIEPNAPYTLDTDLDYFTVTGLVDMRTLRLELNPQDGDWYSGPFYPFQ